MSQDIRIALVVAVADNGVIGLDGRLPWHVSSEMKLFRRLTMGKPLIMGRKTFVSLPGPLDGRDMVVVTRNTAFTGEHAHVVHDMDAALALATDFARKRGADEIMVIGGAEIYRAVLEKAGRIYLSRIHLAPEGDTYFPALEDGGWREVSRRHHEAGPRDDADYSFVILDRRAGETLAAGAPVT